MGVRGSKFYPRNKIRRSSVNNSVNQKLHEVLPGFIFDEIMLAVGLEHLDTCRLVCKEWNKMIMRKLRAMRDYPSKKWGNILERRIEKCWGPGKYPSDKMISHVKTLEENGFISGRMFQDLVERVGQQNCVIGLEQIICASSLAYRGLLNNSTCSKLVKVFLEGDLSSVPAEHLSSLVSCMPERMHIHLKNVTGCDLIGLMDWVMCSSLCIQSQTLGREETYALVRAMETRVEEVKVGNCDKGVNLDIPELVKYSGEGRCMYFECHNTGAKHGKKLLDWATGKPWTLKKIAECYKFELFDFAENCVRIQRREIDSWILN